MAETQVSMRKIKKRPGRRFLAERRATESAFDGTRELMRTLGCGEPKALQLLGEGRIPCAFKLDGGSWKIPKVILAGIADGTVSILRASADHQPTNALPEQQDDADQSNKADQSIAANAPEPPAPIAQQEPSEELRARKSAPLQARSNPRRTDPNL